MANQIDYKSILESVKEIRKALTRRGHRPGYLTIILTPPGDPFIGSGEDMTLDDVKKILQVSLRGQEPKIDDVLTHEICVILQGLKLPEQYAVLWRDRHNGEYLSVVNETMLVPAVGEAMFQIGRLIGLLDGRKALANPPATPAAPSVKITQKKPGSVFRRLLDRAKH